MDEMSAWAGDVCGVDEAGRGPLAGPVCAAAVILDPENPIAGLDDSKKLTERRREALALEIRAKAKAWSIAYSSVEEIDQINILQATMLAMQRAVAGLMPAATAALIDGNRCPVLTIPVRAIIGGDALEPSISAASILAKTARDELMRDLHEKYPHYRLDQHKGYGTKAHQDALARLGPSPIHRLSYKPVAKVLQSFQD